MQRVMRNVQQSVHDLPTSCPERKRVLEGLHPWDKGMDPIALIRTALGKPYKDYTFVGDFRATTFQWSKTDSEIHYSSVATFCIVDCGFTI